MEPDVVRPPIEWSVPRLKTTYVLLSTSEAQLEPCKTSIYGVVADSDARTLRKVKSAGPGTDVYVPKEWLKARDPLLFGPDVIDMPLETDGAPPLVAIAGAKGAWIRLAELRRVEGAQADRLHAACVRAGNRIRCSWDDGALVKRSAKYSGATEPFLPERVVREAFPRRALGDDPDPVPEWHAHSLPEDSRAWLPWNRLQELGDLEDMDLEALLAAGDKYEPSLARFGVLRRDHLVEPCRANNPQGYWFFEASLVIGCLPDLRAPVHAIFSPDAEQSVLPHYAVAGAEGLYVAFKTLRRACEADPETRDLCPDPEMTDAYAIKGLWKCNNVAAALQFDGTLKKINAGNVAGGVMVSVDRLRRERRFRTLLPLLGPGHPELPIEMSEPQRRDRSGCRDSEYAKATKSTVKCGLARRLKDVNARVAIRALVDNVSLQSRSGSLLMNLDLLRLLKGGDGELAGTFAVTATKVYNAMAFARRTQLPSARKYPDLAETASLYGDALSALKVDFIPGITNSVVFEAQQYVTSALNSITAHGEDRIRGLFIACASLHGVWRKGLDTALKSHVRDGAPLEDHLHPELATLAARYRALYLAKGLDGSGGFDVNALSGDAQQRRVTSVFEVHWRLNRDLVEIERAALATGRWQAAGGGGQLVHDLKLEVGDMDTSEPVDEDPEENYREPEPGGFWKRRTFSLLPVNTLRRRHIRIDASVWRYHLFEQLEDLGIEGLDAGSLYSMFAEGGVRRDDVRTMRGGPVSSWLLAPSLTTDATSMGITSYNPERPAKWKDRALAKGDAAAEDAFLDIPEGAVRIGDDPGVINIHSMAWRNEAGEVETATYTQKQYYEDGHIDSVQAKREKRVAEQARREVERLSETRKKTADLDEFLAYVRAFNDGHAALWRVYGSDTAAWERMELYKFKTSAMDRFFMGLRGRFAKDAVLYIGWGNAKFNSIRGCKSVPTSSVSRRVRKTMKGLFTVVDVDEFRTTVLCCACHERLLTGTRWKKTKKKEGWVEDRDVKWCQSPACLESHPCSASPTLLEGARRPAGCSTKELIAVDRDLNAGLAMVPLMGLRNEQRPVAYRR
jgi:hypothetical protein